MVLKNYTEDSRTSTRNYNSELSLVNLDHKIVGYRAHSNDCILFVCLLQVWEASPWMTSWSTPVIHVGKQIPPSSNQLIEKYYGMSARLREVFLLL